MCSHFRGPNDFNRLVEDLRTATGEPWEFRLEAPHTAPFEQVEALGYVSLVGGEFLIRAGQSSVVICLDPAWYEFCSDQTIRDTTIPAVERIARGFGAEEIIYGPDFDDEVGDLEHLCHDLRLDFSEIRALLERTYGESPLVLVCSESELPRYFWDRVR